MKGSWLILLFAAILHCLSPSVLAGHHNHGGSNIAQILAAGLIVQLLSKGHHHHKQHHHHGHHGRHVNGEIHSEYSPYAHGSWVEEARMNPEASLASSSWAQQAPLDIAYSNSQYKEPFMETYNVPYYYNSHNPHPHLSTTGIW